MATILIVDDEPDIRNLLSLKLEREGFSTTEAADGLEGEKRARSDKPDLIILDLMMPGKDGIAVCRALRKDSRTRRIPIIMLTARAGLDERIAGLELGADDYLTKPFSPRELILRVKNVLRRTKEIDSSAVITIGAFSLDKHAMKLYVDGDEVELTSTEFKLLLVMTEVPGQTCERADLLLKVWGYSDSMQTRTLDTHIKRLRTKLGKFGPIIETVRSVGYRFNESAEI